MTRPAQQSALGTGYWTTVHWLQEDEQRGRLQLRRAVLPPPACRCVNENHMLELDMDMGVHARGRPVVGVLLFCFPAAFPSLLQTYWLWLPICKQLRGLCVKIPINSGWQQK